MFGYCLRTILHVFFASITHRYHWHSNQTTGKGITEWDPNGCARCGRSTHWARDCKAKTDVLGGVPKNKPDKSGKKNQRKKLNNLEEDEEKNEPNDEGDDEQYLAEFSDEDECDQLFTLEDDDFSISSDP